MTMRLAFIALALLFAAITAHASDDFAARVQQAKLAEAASTGPAYQKAFWGQIGNATGQAYKTCLAATTPPDHTPFTLVFALDAHGAPQRLATMPAMPVADCMAKTFAGWTFPKPPASPTPYPVEIDFSVGSDGK